MTPELDTTAKSLDHSAENEHSSVKIIQVTKEDPMRGSARFTRSEEDEAEFFRRVTADGKLVAGHTVRSGYAYDFDSTEAVDPRVAARAERIKAELGGEPLHGIEGRPVYRFVKRAFDIAFSAAVIVLFSWLFVIIAIAVKVDDPKGPVFFRQSRVGTNRELKMLKFRSMCVNAEEKLSDLKELNEKSGPVFKIADDPRITRVGRVIRKLSLDEFPQFFNVLIGDIPLRILKTRPGIPCGSRSAFALPAYEERTQTAALLQVEGLYAESLQASPESFDKFTSDIANTVNFFAKPVFWWENTTFLMESSYCEDLDRSACLGVAA